jgi:hypothetical protein
LRSSWEAFRRLTTLSFPQRFPIVQFPNAPLILGLLAGVAATFLSSVAHSYAVSVSYLGIAIWAYEEVVGGVNWFRRLLGATFVLITIVRVAHAVNA